MGIWDFFGRRTNVAADKGAADKGAAQTSAVQDAVRAELAPLSAQLDAALERLAATGLATGAITPGGATAPRGATAPGGATAPVSVPGVLGSTDFLGAPLAAPGSAAWAVTPAQTYAQAYAMNEPRRWRDFSDPRVRPFRAVTTDTLRALAQTYDVLGACLAHLKDQVLKTPLRFAPREDGDCSEETSAQVVAARRFFDTAGGLGGPDTSRLEFEGRWLDDLLVLGACALWFDYQTLGSRMDGVPDTVLAIDAATIRPLVTAWGFAPGPDEAVYEQVVQGVRVAAFRRDEMTYEGLPIFAQTHSPYFLSPIELLVMVVMTALKSDEWNRTWLTDGNVPDRLIQVPKEWTPTQIKEYADYFDALLSGNSRERHRAKMVPEGVTASGESRKDSDFQSFDAWLRDRVCALMGVSPASVGHASDTYQYAQDGARKNTRDNRVAQLLLFRNTLYTDICRRKGWESVQVTDAETDAENAKTRAERHQLLISSGQRTVNECRHADGLDPRPEPAADALLITGSLVPLSKLTEGEDKGDGGKGDGGKGDGGKGDGGKGDGSKPDGSGKVSGGQGEGVPADTTPSQSGASPRGTVEVAKAGVASKVVTLPQSAQDREEREANLAADPDAVKAELSRWERKCLNRLARGESAACEFRSEVLPEELSADVRNLLTACQERESVRSTFALVERLARIEFAPLDKAKHALAPLALLERGDAHHATQQGRGKTTNNPHNNSGSFAPGGGRASAQPSSSGESSESPQDPSEPSKGEKTPDREETPVRKRVREINENWEERIAQAEQAHTEVLRKQKELEESLGVAESARDQPEVKRLKHALEIMEKHNAYAARTLFRVQQAALRKMRAPLFSPQRLPTKLYAINALPGKQGAVVDEAIYNVQRFCGDLSGLPHVMRFFSVNRRSSCDYASKTVYLDVKAPTATAVHELGHWLEASDPKILAKAVAFYEARTAGTEKERLRDLPPKRNYGPDEMTKKDRFKDPYIGKVYEINGKIMGTEIISMGLQYFFEDPAGFADADPEHFDLIYGILHPEHSPA